MIDQIQTIGLIHSGLSSFFMIVDRLARYTARITKARTIHISEDISGFGLNGLPALYSAWIAKEVVRKVQNEVQASIECNNSEDSRGLDNYWDDEPNEAIILETSTSSELRAGKKKTKRI